MKPNQVKIAITKGLNDSLAVVLNFVLSKCKLAKSDDM